MDDAAKRKSEADYTVIMIITDGGISDMAETKAALVALSRKPVSVVLVRRKPSQHIHIKKFKSTPHNKEIKSIPRDTSWKEFIYVFSRSGWATVT